MDAGIFYLQLTLAPLRCRGKMITRVDNHIIWLEPFLKYNLGPFSRLYEAMRVFNGKLFGLAGRTIHRFLEWQYHHKVGSLACATSSPFGAAFQQMSKLPMALICGLVLLSM